MGSCNCQPLHSFNHLSSNFSDLQAKKKGAEANIWCWVAAFFSQRQRGITSSTDDPAPHLFTLLLYFWFSLVSFHHLMSSLLSVLAFTLSRLFLLPSNVLSLCCHHFLHPSDNKQERNRTHTFTCFILIRKQHSAIYLHSHQGCYLARSCTFREEAGGMNCKKQIKKWKQVLFRDSVCVAGLIKDLIIWIYAVGKAPLSFSIYVCVTVLVSPWCKPHTSVCAAQLQ